VEHRVAVFAPSPLLTITVESRGDQPDVHLHAGGQGFWLARMLRSLGTDVVLCASFGGETGTVVRTLIEDEGITLRAVDTESGNATYVHDRRSGERKVVAEMAAAPLSRHEQDALYTMTLVEGLEARACVLGGPSTPDVVPAEMYRRFAHDLTEAGRLVIADLSGDPLRAAAEGGVSVLKMSHTALLREGLIREASTSQCAAVMRVLRDAGAHRVVVSRAQQPALALDDELLEVDSPSLQPVDSRGAGDSMTAGITAALARGAGWEEALRLGAAAGTLNVTRRGLATGSRDEIERLAHSVRVHRIDDDGRASTTTTPDELAARARPA
jgi:1-phosphofructokinase